jgi:2-amino-4-hydroxy-6-hydroxymethyldihydropteridine diphosphokinase
MHEQVFIGMGSNIQHPELGTPLDQLKKAAVTLSEDSSITDVKTSSFYASTPMGPQNQPNYINAAVQVRCSCSADGLLDKLQHIEQQFGRVREKQRWGPRTLDLDILLFDQQIIQTKRLTIPHYGMAEREFVLVPLFELAPDMVMPDGRPIASWVANCSLKGLRRLKSELKGKELSS